MKDYVKPNATGETDETDAEESAESPQVEKTEQDTGVEKPTVKVPEKFQQECQTLIAGANASQLNYLRDEIMQRESELRKAESKSEKSATFDTEGMPE